MKFTILKDAFNEAIQHVSKAISSRTTIPILSGIKIDATEKGLTLTASDTEVTIQSFVPAERAEIQTMQLQRAGSAVLPAKFLSEMVRKLPSNEVEIETAGSFQATLRSGTSEIQMVGLDPEEYPMLPVIDENSGISIASDLLKTMIRQTSFAVSTSETTPVLTGVLWNFTGEKVKLVGCDRHRLASRDIDMQLAEGQRLPNAVISGKTLGELNKILPDENMLVDVIVSDNQVLFRLENILFYTRVLDGTYPDTAKLIPETHSTELVIATKMLADAIDRAYLLSREDKSNIVKMVMKENGTVEISSSSSELGKVTETLPATELNGDLLRISFNSKYMLDALKVFESDYIRFGFTGAMSPIIIRPEDGTSLLQLILPYRTTG